jgi:hypothetical protein
MKYLVPGFRLPGFCKASYVGYSKPGFETSLKEHSFSLI